MAEFIVFPDVEIAVVAELMAKLPTLGEDDMTVSPRMPKTRPAKFVRVVVTGGSERDMLTDSPLVTVEAFASLEGEAERLAARCRAIISASPRAGSLGGVTCYGVRIAGRPVNLPMETVPDRFRYTFTFSADLRGSAV